MAEEKQRRARSMVSRLAFAATDDALSSHLSSIRHLSRTDPSIRPFLVDSGLVPHLLLHLLHSPPIFQELASATLLNLSITSPESIMATPSLLSSLSHSLDSETSSSSDTVLQNVSATLYSLLSVDAYRPIIGSKKPILKSLLSLLSSPASSARTLKDSLKALFALSLYALNRPVLVSLGAVPSLLALILREPRTGIVEDATAVVAQVAGCCESVDAMREAGGGGLGALVGLARGRGGRTRENVASALLNLARSGGDRAVGDIREMEGVEEVVRELVEAAGTSARGRAKGEELLKVLAAHRRGHHCDCWIEDDSSTQPAVSTSFPSSSSSSSSSSFPSSTSSYSYSYSSASSGDAF